GVLPEEEREFQERQRKAARIVVAGAIALVVLLVVLVIAYRARVASRVRPEQPVAPESAPAAVPESSAPAPVQAPPPASTTSARETSSAVAPASQFRLEIAPIADCWVSVAVEARKMLARVIPAGEKQSFAVVKEAVVEVGDAGAFAYAVNGKPGKSLGDKGQVRTL